VYLHVLLNEFLGFCSEVVEVSDLPGCDTVSNPRRTDTSCPSKLVPLKALSYLQLFLNTMQCIASDEMGNDHCIKLEYHIHAFHVSVSYISQHIVPSYAYAPWHRVFLFHSGPSM
jgi:hypothetical protein